MTLKSFATVSSRTGLQDCSGPSYLESVALHLVWTASRFPTIVHAAVRALHADAGITCGCGHGQTALWHLFCGPCSFRCWDAPNLLNLLLFCMQAISRFKKNTAYFRINYGIFVLLTTVVCMVLNPSSLVVLGILSAVWFYLFVVRQASITIGGRPFRCLSFARVSFCNTVRYDGYAEMLYLDLQLTWTHM